MSLAGGSGKCSPASSVCRVVLVAPGGKAAPLAESVLCKPGIEAKLGIVPPFRKLRER